jgi:hypothetical protein
VKAAFWWDFGLTRAAFTRLSLHEATTVNEAKLDLLKLFSNQHFP